MPKRRQARSTPFAFTRRLPEDGSPYRRAMFGGRGSLGIVVQTVDQFAPTVFGVGVFSERDESIVIEASVQFDSKLFA